MTTNAEQIGPKVFTVPEFCKEQGFVSVNPNLRHNMAHGYPFLTFLTDKKDENGRTIAENIYFSKNEAAFVGEKPRRLDDEYLKSLKVIETERVDEESGEVIIRYKLSRNESNYVSIADIWS